MVMYMIIARQRTGEHILRQQIRNNKVDVHC
jgi:hypothetical protein